MLKRIKQKVHKLLQNLKPDDQFIQQMQVLQQIADQANSKARYLSYLYKLNKGPFLSGVFGGINKDQMTIKSFYSGGDVFIDPCNRESFDEFKALKKLWDIEVEKDRTTPSFLMWLEDKEKIFPCLTTMSMVDNRRFFQYAEIKISEEGLIKNINNEVVTIDRSAYMIDARSTLYIGALAAQGLHMEIRNSNFLDRTGFLCAGEIRVENGKITYIDNGSGHFVPRPFHLQEIVKYYASKGVFAPDATIALAFDHNVQKSFKINNNNYEAFKVEFEEVKRNYTCFTYSYLVGNKQETKYNCSAEDVVTLLQKAYPKIIKACKF